PDPAAPDPLTHALPADVALGKVDYLEVGGFSDHLATAEVWYRLLNTGFRLPAGAGTDAMANFAALHGPVGMNRVFVHSGPRLDYRGWLAALKAGRTFVSNGPLLGVTLNARGGGCRLVGQVGRAARGGGRRGRRVDQRGGKETCARPPGGGEGGVRAAGGRGGPLGEERERPRHRLDGERTLDFEFLPVRFGEH